MSAEAPGVRRSYQALRRAQSASQTRMAIHTAAMRLFLERGYGNVTVGDIAAQVAVAIPTVYASAGGKATILARLIADAQADPIAAETLPALRICTHARDVIQVTAHGARMGNERCHDIIQVIVTAAAADKSFISTLAAVDRAYRAALGEVAARLGELCRLQVTQLRATDILWFYLGHQAWHLCVTEQGWSWDEAQEWLGARVAAALLGLPSSKPDERSTTTRSGEV